MSYWPIHDAKRGSVACFVDAHKDARWPLATTTYCLEARNRRDVSDVAQISCGAVDSFYRKVVQLVDAFGLPFISTVYSRLAEFCGAGGESSFDWPRR